MSGAFGHALGALRAFPADLRRQLAAVPPAELDWRPPDWEGIPSERLTIRQQICHLRDIEAEGYFVRFRRLLGEREPFLASIDGDALVLARGYDSTDPWAALDAFATARAETLALLDGLAETALQRRGRFEGYGPVSVQGLVHFLASHDQQHLAGIQWLLGMAAASRG